MTAKKSTILIAVAFLLLEASWGQAQSEVILFKLESAAGVFNNPPQRTLFSLDQPAFITKIFTYHWNNGNGATPGRIGLRNTATGQMVGKWNVIGTYHMFNSTPGADWPSQGDGPPFLYWTVQPNVNVPAGTYEVVDSDHSTWSYNAEMQNMGCAWIYGMYGGGGYGQVAPPPMVASGSGHWERRAAEIRWQPGTESYHSDAQPHSGDQWHSAPTLRRLDSVSSNHVAISAHDERAPANQAWGHVECSWTEPPQTLSPGQMVQLQLQATGEANCYLFAYEGGLGSHSQLAHLGTGTVAATPYKVPDAHNINSDSSKAEFGFWIGPDYIDVYYRYHWVGGSAGLYSPAPQQGMMSVRITPAQQTINSGDKAVTTADVTGGAPPYTFAWYNGTKQSQVIKGNVTWTMGAAGTRDIKVVVSDSAGNTAEAHAQIVVQ